MTEQLNSHVLKHILCAVDGTEHSDAAVEFATTLARATTARITFLAVKPYLLGRGGPIPIWDPAKSALALDQARATAARAGISEVQAAEASASDVANAIVLVANERKADHIVVGSGSKNALQRAFVGSVSSDVVHRAHCPVTVVH